MAVGKRMRECRNVRCRDSGDNRRYMKGRKTEVREERRVVLSSVWLEKLEAHAFFQFPFLPFTNLIMKQASSHPITLYLK